MKVFAVFLVASLCVATVVSLPADDMSEEEMGDADTSAEDEDMRARERDVPMTRGARRRGHGHGRRRHGKKLAAAREEVEEPVPVAKNPETPADEADTAIKPMLQEIQKSLKHLHATLERMVVQGSAVPAVQSGGLQPAGSVPQVSTGASHPAVVVQPVVPGVAASGSVVVEPVAVPANSTSA